MKLRPEALKRLADAVARAVRPFIMSRTLRASLVVKPTRDGGLSFSFRQYWARFYIEGRGAVSGNLIYFKDPRDDPRLTAGYPATFAREVRKLTSEELADAIAEDRVIVTKAVGPAPPHPFLDQIQPEDPEIESELSRAMDDFVTESVLKGAGRRGARPR